MEATVLNTDNTTSTYSLPRSGTKVRGAAENISVNPNASNNLFELSDGYSEGIVTTNLTRINRRYFMLSDVIVEAAGSPGGDTTTSALAVNIRPDARGQLHKVFTVGPDTNGDEAECTLIGHINWDTGVIQYGVTTTTDSAGVTFTASYATAKTVFSPKSGDVGRVKVKIKMSGFDIDIDVKDDFEIELESETIQD